MKQSLSYKSRTLVAHSSQLYADVGEQHLPFMCFQEGSPSQLSDLGS
jgi:hypothetical protein